MYKDKCNTVYHKGVCSTITCTCIIKCEPDYNTLITCIQLTHVTLTYMYMYVLYMYMYM